MPAAATDLLQKVAIATATTLDAPGYTIGDTSITVASTSTWPTDTGITFAIDEVDADGVRVANSYNEYVGTVASGTSVTNVSHVNGTNRNFTAGATTRVYIPVSEERENRIVTWGTADHSQLGAHEISTNYDPANPTLETQKWAGVSAAVNEVTVTNAITGSPPLVGASGGDTNINLKLQGKGEGRAYLDSFSTLIFDHVASGCVWSGDSYGSTRAASMTAGTVYIGGQPVPVAAVTARSFTASRDTYIDVGTDGVIDYTEVTNNNASPALAANHIRIGIIVTDGTDIQDAGSINQGQETKVLPIASSIAYSVTDSLGNLICPRDPNRKLLGYRQIVANVTGIAWSTSDADHTGLSVPVIVPAGRKIKIEVFGGSYSVTGAIGTGYVAHKIKESTTLLAQCLSTPSTANFPVPIGVKALVTPSTGSHTYKSSFAMNTTGPNYAYDASATSPMFIRVELV